LIGAAVGMIGSTLAVGGTLVTTSRGIGTVVAFILTGVAVGLIRTGARVAVAVGTA